MPRAWPAYSTGSLSYCQERMFLEIYQEFGRRASGIIRTTSRHPLDTALRAMRRKSGLKMIASDGRAIACFKSEYCVISGEKPYMWTHKHSSRYQTQDKNIFSFAMESIG